MASRIISIRTALPAAELLIRSATIREQLSQPFLIEIDLLSENAGIDFDALLGTETTLTLLTQGEIPRHFHGFIEGFAQLGRSGRYEVYRARVVPWLSFLSHTTDCCIYQNKHVPEILDEVFRKHGFSDIKSKLTTTYRTRDYCVQYRESTLNFVQRLMEEEGIYYYFQHEENRHVLVLADSYSAHEAFPGYEVVEYLPLSDNVRRYEDCVHEWRVTRSIRPGKYATTDYDFTKPREPLQAQYLLTRKVPKSDFEVFDYPGKYAALQDGNHYARVRLESLQTGYETAKGNGNVRGLAAGSLFTLKGCPRGDQNRQYLVTSVVHQVQAGDYETGTGESTEDYSCHFEAMDSKQPFRAARNAVKARVDGPQTAVVVGPASEEIWTDEYGRVKVKFHWDRDPKRDESSSCWVRVSQTWAGRNWGSVTIPRIGQEVIVDFLEGDPDQPFITGSVYNQVHMPPYALPGAAVISGIKSQTHKGGGYTEISMDDTAGQERLTVHAQYDLGTTVQHDETHTVKSGNRAMTVETGTNTETIKGNSALTIQAGARIVDVTGGDYSATSSQAVKFHGKGAGVNVLGDVSGVTMEGNGEGVTITGNGEGLTMEGNGKGVKITGNGEGVSMTGNDMGVDITGKGLGVAIVGTASAGREGGEPTGVLLHGEPSVVIDADRVFVGANKIVLEAPGGFIVIDGNGVTIDGVIVKIN